MKFETRFFRSKVAQRITILFILCALLPIVTLGVLSFRQVTKQLQEQNQGRLHHTNKSLSMAIIERLLFLETEMRMVASNLSTDSQAVLDTPSQGFNKHLSKRFRRIFLFTNEGKYQTLLGESQNLHELTPEEKQHIQFGETVVTSKFHADQSPSIIMSMAIDPEHMRRGILLAEIEPLYLWYMGYEDVLPQMTELCVLDHLKNVLFSSYPSPFLLPEQITREIDNTSSSQFEWTYKGKKYLASYRDIFMQSSFFSPKWTVVLSESKIYVYAPMAYFKKTFPFVILLSLWVVLLLSISQIRRSLVPLEKLKEGAQRIANKDFESKVLVTSRDEFEEVAESFNSMASRLDRQFKTLITIAEIDRAILSTIDVKKVVDTVLNRMPQVFHCDGVSISLLDANVKYTGKTFFIKNNPVNKKLVEKIKLKSKDIQELLNKSETLAIELDNALPHYLMPLAQQGNKSFQIFPIFLKQKLSGIITLGYRKRPELTPEDLSQARQLSDQVGVALSNAQLVKELKQFNWGTLIALARTIDAKSPWTAGHSERVTKIALDIGRVIRLAKREMDILRRGGLLHDIGKLGISNEILQKKRKLTSDERKIIQTHTRLGARILEPISAYTDIMLIVLQHHENFDGTGYPDGLAGENISLYSRIFSVADNYEALTSDRPYRRAIDCEQAIEYIKQNTGHKFDPKVVEAFLKVYGKEKQ